MTSEQFTELYVLILCIGWFVVFLLAAIFGAQR